MSFLQPWLLVALPLAALPIIIHLINQRRYQTIRWAAMMFLLAANRMSRGYARIRQWLILAFRVLAVAVLIFAISRPLASGWLGLTAGGRPDTTIVLLDRSPSMQQSRGGVGGSKLETARQQMARTMQTLGSAHWVLIDSATASPREYDSPQALVQSPAAEPVSASADLPAMLQAAHDYIQTNKSGRTEIWICSDLRQNDWNADSGRWQSLRDAFRDFPQGVRFHLLAYPQMATGNVAVRITSVRRTQTGEGAELLVSLKLTREGNDDSRTSVPVHFEIEGARSELTLEMDGPQYELKDHRISLESSRERGWGKVSIPADANPADNDFYFAFDKPVPRKTLIVADDPLAARPLQLAAAISPDPAVACTAEIIETDRLPAVDWNEISLLLWQAPLPDGEQGRIVREFIERGGYAIFFPARVPGSDELFGVRWRQWTEPPEEIPIENWRSDQDLLAHTLSGAGLPVGKLQIRRYCGLEGEMTSLATVRGGATLLGRAVTERGGAYFCATTTAPGDSSLAVDGVAFYIMVQRALARGAAVLGNTRQLIAGDAAGADSADWQRIAGADQGLSTEYAYHRGVYASGERLFAVNRDVAEDQAAVLADVRVSDLFRGLDFARVDDEAGSIASLVQEIWRAFLACMIVALIVEAALCLPRLLRPAGVPA